MPQPSKSRDAGPTRKGKFAQALSGMADNVNYARHLIQGNKIPSRLPVRDDHRVPVVLVHGFLGTRATMAPLTKRFSERGRTVFSYAHGKFNTASIQDSAQGLVRQLRMISQDFGGEKVDLVAFSFGGLLSMYALQSLGAARYVRSLVMLGTPLRGSWLSVPGAAVLGALSSAVWQLLPSSPILKQIRERSLPPQVRVAQVFASSDRFCPEPGKLAQVRDEDYIRAPGGHSSLIVAPNFFRILQAFHDRVDQELTVSQELRPSAT